MLKVYDDDVNDETTMYTYLLEKLTWASCSDELKWCVSAWGTLIVDNDKHFLNLIILC